MTHKVPDLPGVKGGGVNISFRQKGSIFDVTPTPERREAVAGIRDVTREAASDIADLRGRVRPGFGELTEARVQAIRNRRRRTVGNLRENLQRRRVLGSSFGQDALARAEAEFAREEAEARAKSFLQEFEATQNLLGREFELRRSGFQALLDDLNFQSDLAARLAGAGGSSIARNASEQARLEAEASAGIGDLAFSFLTTPLEGTVLGKGVEKLGDIF